jgi:hypothetical protein
MSKTERPNPHDDYSREVLNEAKALFNTDRNTWKLISNITGTKLYEKDRKDVCPLPCYLVETDIKQEKDVLVGKVWDVNEDGAKLNDPKILTWEEVDVDKSAGWKICSQKNSAGWPVWPRQFIFAQTKIEEKDTTYLVAHSVVHSDVKVDEKKYVRGNIHLSVYAFKDNGDKTTNVWRITQVDPCGNIPHWLVKMYSANLADMFNRWKSSSK